MFCSTCGVKVAESLSYCNYCGARIVTSNTEVVISREVKPELLVSMMVSTFVFGLLAIAVLLGVMKSALGFNVGQILAFACLSFLTMLLLEGTFARLLFRRHRGLEDQTRPELSAGHTTRELGPSQVQPLPEPLTSVTDHTTRAFEPLYTKRNKTT